MVNQLIEDRNIDFLFLTESWLSSDSPPSITNSLTPPNYSFLHVSRPTGGGGGGGVAAIFKSNHSIASITTPTFTSFENMLLRLTCSTKSYLFLIVYRPPSCSKAAFLLDFTSLLEVLAAYPSEFII